MEGQMNEPPVLPMRARLRRALRFPWVLWDYRQQGLSWRSAWRMTHVWVWTDSIDLLRACVLRAWREDRDSANAAH